MPYLSNQSVTVSLEKGAAVAAGAKSKRQRKIDFFFFFVKVRSFGGLQLLPPKMTILKFEKIKSELIRPKLFS